MITGYRSQIHLGDLCPVCAKCVISTRNREKTGVTPPWGSSQPCPAIPESRYPGNVLLQESQALGEAERRTGDLGPGGRRDTWQSELKVELPHSFRLYSKGWKSGYHVRHPTF